LLVGSVLIADIARDINRDTITPRQARRRVAHLERTILAVLRN
jgi:hypothetical protein